MGCLPIIPRFFNQFSSTSPTSSYGNSCRTLWYIFSHNIGRRKSDSSRATPLWQKLFSNKVSTATGTQNIMPNECPSAFSPPTRLLQGCRWQSPAMRDAQYPGFMTLRNSGIYVRQDELVVMLKVQAPQSKSEKLELRGRRQCLQSRFTTLLLYTFRRSTNLIKMRGWEAEPSQIRYICYGHVIERWKDR